jgi:plasmid stabilization system protein ParE
MTTPTVAKTSSVR